MFDVCFHSEININIALCFSKITENPYKKQYYIYFFYSVSKCNKHFFVSDFEISVLSVSLIYDY